MSRGATTLKQTVTAALAGMSGLQLDSSRKSERFPETRNGKSCICMLHSCH
jgi:hypothetical protein